MSRESGLKRDERASEEAPLGQLIFLMQAKRMLSVTFVSTRRLHLKQRQGILFL